MRRSLVVAALLAGCSLLYDPAKLPSGGGELSDASLGNEPRDAASSDRDARNDDASPMADASQPKLDGSTTMPDAQMVDARPVDAATPDAATPDAKMVDAATVDAPPDAHCGSTNEVCCPGMMCEPHNECSGGTCHHCGGNLESCCDPGMTCDGILVCIAGVCTL